MAEKPDITLIKQTLDMIELAKSKGFEYSWSIKPFMHEHWMPFAEVFCNQACTVINWWLRDRHKFNIWVAPKDNGTYQGYIKYFGVVAFGEPVDDSTSYEKVFISALIVALNALPPAAQEAPIDHKNES